MFLEVQDTRWDQFAYQFSHELCHIFTNFEHRGIDAGAISRDHQWFDESICEAVSILTLNRLTAAWERSPPHPGWNAYAPAFAAYAQRLLDEPHRRLSNQSPREWYGANRVDLDMNPYLRQKNELLAARLLTLIEHTPGGLEAIGFLNLDKPQSAGDMRDYLRAWYSRCPKQYRGIIGQVIALLGQDRKSLDTAAVL
jgi:hypothetical protein